MEIICKIRRSWDNINFSQQEDLIVKEYLLDKNKGIDFLNQEISPILNSREFEVKFASVFTHQKPLITRIDDSHGGNKRCELGDLLVVFSFMDRNGQPILNRAFISQAKKRRSIDNKCQKYLYDCDLGFRMPKNIYSKSKTCQDPKRFWPKYFCHRAKSLKYILLLSPTNVFVINTPWDLQIGLCWELCLYFFILGYDGLRFSRKPYRTCGWSSIVWDLVSIVAQEITGKKKYGAIPRGNHISLIVNYFNKFRNYENYRIEYEGEGIPTLFIFIKDNEILL